MQGEKYPEVDLKGTLLMKIAFLIFNHRGPAQLTRLLTVLRSQLPESPIVVHHDKFHGDLPRTSFEAIDNVHLLESGTRVTWGDFSLVDVCSWSLVWMREHLEFDWIVVLSAQDYPIKPLAGLAADLTTDDADAVFAATPIEQLTAVQRIFMGRRYFFRYRLLVIGLPHRLSDRARKILRDGIKSLTFVMNNLQPMFKIYMLPSGNQYLCGRRIFKTPFRGTWNCWSGSSWFALSRSALGCILDYMADHPEYVDYYRGTMNCDESMFATLAFNLTNLRVANRYVTYTRWRDRRSDHPDTFQLGDLEELVAAPEFFARKFDIGTDAAILDALDDFIGRNVSADQV
jgi:hypothetical protein